MNRLIVLLIAVLFIYAIYQFFTPQNTQFATEAPPSFNSYPEMMEYHSQLEVPGYGSSTGGFGTFTPWGQFTFFTVEVPDQHKFSVFIYKRKNESTPYQFIEAFTIEGEEPPMLTFETENYQLYYQYKERGEIRSKKSIISG